jgi:ERCC4-type nuclease
MKILVDTREQAPLEFEVSGNISGVKQATLSFGDYGAEFEDGTAIPIVFERKSMQDLFATLSNEDGIRRHKAKIERAKEAKTTLYLIVEGSLTDAYDGVRFTKVDPAGLVKRVFTFKVKYGLHPIFCTDREEMVRYMIETWEAFGRSFKKVAA